MKQKKDLHNITALSFSRLDWVDGLKGLSAIIVVLNHIICTLDGPSILYQEKQLPIVHNIYDGNFAVHIFIILSSLLVCYGLERYRENILMRYHYLVLKRYFRILIPVGLIIIIMYLGNSCGLFYAEEYGVKTGNKWLIGQYIDFKDLPGCIFAAPLGKCYKVLNVGWMLGYVFFATFWVILMDILTYKKKWETRVVLLICCCYIALRVDFYYINVVVGFVLYSFRDFINNKPLNRTLLICSIIGFIAVDFIKYTEMWNMMRAIFLTIIVFCSNFLQRVFCLPFLKWLGKISMNIYLLQLFVLYTITCRLSDGVPHTLKYTIFIYVSSLTLIIILAWVFTKFVEPFLNRFTNFIYGKLSC